MSGPALQIQQAAQQLATLLPAHAALVELGRDLTPDALSASPTPVVPITGADGGTIVLDRVTFTHADGGGVHGVDLIIRSGEIVGLVGASGAGKTTLVDLIAGLIAPQAGSITLGGAPVDHRRVAYVAQDGFLVHDTLRRNLTLDGPAVGDDALHEVLALVGATALVDSLAQGLDTTVAERGARLSGGERQRIALARALLRRPALLILDEATNAIDIAGERTILDMLAALPKRPATVIVAHREESLARCDRVLMLKTGRLVEGRDLTD
nr:ABC transporter ATP-binding protein [Sphingomonas hominis]